MTDRDEYGRRVTDMAAHYCPDCGKVRTPAEGVLCIECGKRAVRRVFAAALGR